MTNKELIDKILKWIEKHEDSTGNLPAELDYNNVVSTEINKYLKNLRKRVYN